MHLPAAPFNHSCKTPQCYCEILCDSFTFINCSWPRSFAGKKTPGLMSPLSALLIYFPQIQCVSFNQPDTSKCHLVRWAFSASRAEIAAREKRHRDARNLVSLISQGGLIVCCKVVVPLFLPKNVCQGHPKLLSNWNLKKKGNNERDYADSSCSLLMLYENFLLHGIRLFLIFLKCKTDAPL